MAQSQRKLGRLPRARNPRVPHMSSLLAGRAAAALPSQIDYTSRMPAQLGIMMNDTLGDCTCAAYYHAIQVWSFNAAQNIDTEPDIDVEDLYIQACGYNPKRGGEGPGGNEQHVLTFLLNTGAPLGPNGQNRHRISAFVEADPRNQSDVKQAIFECGVAYIGFNVPANIMPPNAPPPSVWDVVPGAQTIGGHAVVLAGYDDQGARVISWGEYYTMTWNFFSAYVDEAYAIADSFWINATTGKTFCGLTLSELEQLMQSLKET